MFYDSSPQVVSTADVQLLVLDTFEDVNVEHKSRLVCGLIFVSLFL